MRPATRKRFRRLLLASTLTLLGATEPTHGQEAAPIHATQATETFPAGTQVTLGYAGEDGNIPVFANGDAVGKFSAALIKANETKDVRVLTRTTINLLNSGESHHYKSGTPCTIVKQLGFSDFYLMRVEGKNWITTPGVLHPLGTAPPVVATPTETKESLPVVATPTETKESLPVVATPTETKESLLEKRYGLAGMTYKVDGSDYYLYSGPQKVDHSGYLHLLRLFPSQPP